MQAARQRSPPRLRHRAAPRICLAGLLLALQAPASADPCAPKAYVLPKGLPAEAVYVPREVIVRFADPSASRDLSSRKLERLYCVAATGSCVYRFPQKCGDDPAIVANRLMDRSFACVEPDERPGTREQSSTPFKAVFPNAIGRIPESDTDGKLSVVPSTAQWDEYFPWQVQLTAMGAESAWLAAMNNPESGIVTAVIDSGVFLSHPDLPREKLETGYSIPCNKKPCDGSASAKDPDSHGTMMATVIAAARNGVGIMGVAWNTKLMPIRSASSGVIPDAIAADAIACAISKKASVINYSFAATRKMPETAQVLADNARGDFLLIAAVGNLGKDLNDEPAYPASIRHPATNKPFSQVVAVMSHDEQGFRGRNTGWGKGIVSIAAPERAYAGIICKRPDRDRAACFSRGDRGSSNAAAYASGAAALLWSNYPHWNHADILWRIVSNMEPEPDLSGSMTVPAKLNLERMMFPVRFTSASLRTISKSGPDDVDDSRAFPTGMCDAGMRTSLRTPGQATRQKLKDFAVNDLVQITTECLRRAGSPYIARSPIYTVVN